MSLKPTNGFGSKCVWQGRQDSNLRRAGLESAALAGLSYAPLTPSVWHLSLVTGHGFWSGRA